MLKKILFFIVILIPSSHFAQTFEKEFETNFVWEVKQIDEFIDRFNNVDATLINEYNKKHNASVKLTREKLIKSLFNTQRKDWNFADITELINQVNNKENPIFLDFNRENWCAKLICKVFWKGKIEKATLKLIVKNQSDGSCKWVISDIDAKFLFPKKIIGIENTIDQPHIPMADNANDYLNPISHTNDFMDIDKVTDTPKSIGNFIIKSDSYSENMCLFIKECLKKNIKILGVSSIKYSFLQIKGWEMIIEQFNRQSKNSGWLISKLNKVSS